MVCSGSILWCRSCNVFVNGAAMHGVCDSLVNGISLVNGMLPLVMERCMVIATCVIVTPVGLLYGAACLRCLVSL